MEPDVISYLSSTRVCVRICVGSNKISQAVCAAHDGGIFSICVVKDGTVITGGKDRRLIEWNAAYQRTGREHEVRLYLHHAQTSTENVGN